MAPSRPEEVTVEKDTYEHARSFPTCEVRAVGPAEQGRSPPGISQRGTPGQKLPRPWRSLRSLYLATPPPPGAKMLATFHAPDPAEEGPVEASGRTGRPCVLNVKAAGW